MDKLYYFKCKAGIYAFIHLKGNKYQPYHRYLMEKHIGRKLSNTENVHHINHNQLDNRIENLKIVSSSEHYKIHNPEGSIPKKNINKDLLKQLREKGLSVYKIAKILEIGKSSVHRRLQEYAII
jgi:predicted transcriptional regulator YheO